jgi:hypothetical protein
VVEIHLADRLDSEAPYPWEPSLRRCRYGSSLWLGFPLWCGEWMNCRGGGCITGKPGHH